MNRTQRIAIAGLAVFAGLILVFVLRNREAPRLLPDADHAWKGTDACLVCHDADGRSPRSPNHPVGRDCLRCHARAR